MTVKHIVDRLISATDIAPGAQINLIDSAPVNFGAFFPDAMTISMTQLRAIALDHDFLWPLTSC